MNTIPSVYKSMFCLGLGYDTLERHQFRRKKLMKRKRHKTTYTKMEAKKIKEGSYRSNTGFDGEQFKSIKWSQTSISLWCSIYLVWPLLELHQYFWINLK